MLTFTYIQAVHLHINPQAKFTQPYRAKLNMILVMEASVVKVRKMGNIAPTVGFEPTLAAISELAC